MFGSDWPGEKRDAVPRYMIARLIATPEGEQQQSARKEAPAVPVRQESEDHPLPARGSRAQAAAGEALGAKTVAVRVLIDASGDSGKAGDADLGSTPSGLSARVSAALDPVSGGGGSPAPGDPLTEIRRLIETHKSYPRLARRKGWEGEVIVELSLDGSGALQDVQVVRRSGHRVLDRATLAAVRSAGPFPPLPGRVQVPVSYRIDK